MQAWAPLPGVSVSAPDGQLVVDSPWCGGTPIQLDDRIELRPGGGFQYLGRNQELVKIAGKRAHAHELEATVRAVPGVTDVAVLVHAAAGKEARVAMAVSVAPGASVTRDAIVAEVRQHFDAVFVPKIIKLVPALPRTDRGKLDAQALRELLGITVGPTTDQIPTHRIGPGQYTAEIPGDLIFFRGHFDAFTILPGAVLVERLVWPIVKTELPEIGALRGIRRLRFRKPVMPEQQLLVTVSRAAGRLTFEVSCAEAVVASGQLLVD
jgi:3-hydroxymyristoyl/3-hydroxydecanoyl-(acyl carrier protein) dehydratase